MRHFGRFYAPNFVGTVLCCPLLFQHDWISEWSKIQKNIDECGRVWLACGESRIVFTQRSQHAHFLLSVRTKKCASGYCKSICLNTIRTYLFYVCLTLTDFSAPIIKQIPQPILKCVGFLVGVMTYMVKNPNSNCLFILKFLKEPT